MSLDWEIIAVCRFVDPFIDWVYRQLRLGHFHIKVPLELKEVSPDFF